MKEDLTRKDTKAQSATAFQKDFFATLRLLPLREKDFLSETSELNVAVQERLYLK